MASSVSTIVTNALSRSSSWESNSVGSHTRSRSSSPKRPTRAPFAFDDLYEQDLENMSLSDKSMSSSSVGYRVGGPKEARLHRVALLSKAKETDHLHPVKVYNVPKTASPEKLETIFSQYGEVGDVYIPADYTHRTSKGDFAIVRYKNRDAAEKLLPNVSESDAFAFSPPASPTSFSTVSTSPLKSSASFMINTRPSTSDGRPLLVDGRPVSVGPLEKQRSYFKGGTGYHGICNEVVEDGTYNRSPVQVQQDISLSSCLSRSGYPWGSVRELKFLAPHLPLKAYEYFTMRIENLHPETTPEEIKKEFEMRMNCEVFVDCPKPVVVTELIKGPNNGFAFVRFEDKRDRDAAVNEVKSGKIKFRGQTVTGKDLVPGYWPNQNTRRYY